MWSVQQEIACGKTCADSFSSHIAAPLTDEDITRVKSHLKKAQTLASVCTGSGMAELAHKKTMAFAKQATRVDFTCESNTAKQRFLQKTIHPSTSSQPCLFSDLTRLGSGCGKCIVHDAECAVPKSSDILVGGISCKTVSKAVGLSHQEALDLILSGEGSAGSTLRGLLELVALTLPGVIVLENVDGIVKSGAAEFIFSALGELNYFGTIEALEAEKYMLPHRRTRVYFLFFHSPRFAKSPQELAQLAHNIFKTVTRFQHQALPLGCFLHTQNSAHVSTELSRRVDQLSAHGDNSDSSAKWLPLHTNFLRQKGLTRALVSAPMSVRASPWLDTLTAREQ